MSLTHALLGLLNYRSATGYELKTTFTKSIHFFWDATLPQIYRTLKKMEADGWLTFTVEHQEGKPNRKVYTVTDIGRKELRRWLAEPPEIPQPRNPMLMKVFFGNQMDVSQFVAHLQKWRQYHADLVKRYEQEIIPLVQRYAAHTGAFQDAPFWVLTLDHGQRSSKMVIDWCDAALAAINQTQPVKSIKPVNKKVSSRRKNSRR